MSRSTDELQSVPGVGPSIAEDLRRVGVKSLADLADQDPEALYARLIELEGRHVDRCVLYVFRCAVHFAEAKDPDLELRKWWNWTDERMASRALAQPKRHM